MTFQEIKELLVNKFGEAVVVKESPELLQPQLTVKREMITEVCQELYSNEKTYFDFLACITGIDNGPASGTMEVIYNLHSIPFEHHLTLRIEFSRNEGKTDLSSLPRVPSVSKIWKSADWHEREAFDLLGIVFEGHQDLRRILLPADWEGFPLRKDYKHQDYYHGIKVEY
jgi:NADH-quinone oxidoreductase subunit C